MFRIQTPCLNFKYYFCFAFLMFYTQEALVSAAVKNDVINDFLYVEKSFNLKPLKDKKSTDINEMRIQLNQLEALELSERVRRRFLEIQQEAKTTFFRPILPNTITSKTPKIFTPEEAKLNVGKTIYFEFHNNPKIIAYFQSLPELNWIEKMKEAANDLTSKITLKNITCVANLRRVTLKDFDNAQKYKTQSEKTQTDKTPPFYDYLTSKVKEPSLLALKDLLKSEDRFIRVQAAFSLAYLGDTSGRHELTKLTDLEEKGSSLTNSSIEIFYGKAGLIFLGAEVPKTLLKKQTMFRHLEDAVNDCIPTP